MRYKQFIFRKSTGIQYEVMLEHNLKEQIFIIRKFKRDSPTEITPLAYYYVVKGKIYRAPYFMSVLSTRLVCFYKSLYL